MKKQILIVMSMFILWGCEEDEPLVASNSNTLKIEFKHYYKNQLLSIQNDNTLNYINSTSNEYNVKSLKYYISKLMIERDNGTLYDVDMYKLINAGESDAYNTFTLTDIPEGRYTQLHFMFGIDSARNVLQGLPNNSETNSMEWPVNLGGGYHFMMMEGVFKRSDNSLSGYAIHLGKTPNQYKAEFGIDLTYSNTSARSIEIKMNIDQWFDGQNKVDLNNGYSYIMEDSIKQLQFQQNASSVFSIVQK